MKKKTYSPTFWTNADAIRWAENHGWKGYKIEGDSEMSCYWAVLG